MSLLRTSALNGVAVSVRMLTGLVVNKLLALYVGPAGYAVVGQFQNMLSILTTFASAAVNTGVTKYTAEHAGDDQRTHRLWSTAAALSVGASLSVSLLLLLFRDAVAMRIVGSRDFAGVIGVLAVCLPLISLNGLLMAVMQGRKEVRRYVAANIAGSLIAFVVSAALIRGAGLQGALAALVVNQGLLLLVTLAFVRHTEWFRRRHFMQRFDPSAARSLSKFVVMAVTTAVTLPVAQMLLRDQVVETLGAEAAGYWDAVNRLSGIYLTLITTSLSLYYLPRLSEIRGAEEIRSEIWAGYRTLVPIFAAVSLLVYLLREQVVALLFTPAFAPMASMFAWQLTGDVVKVCSWLLGYVLVGRAMLLPFVLTEIGFAASLFLCSLVGMQTFGLRGLSMGYALNYVVHWGVLYLIVVVRGGVR